jgi:hypothetical protein
MTKSIKIKKIDDFSVSSGNFREALAGVEELILRDTVSGLPIEKNQAKAKLAWSQKGLYLYFDVEDEHIWGTRTEDDDSIFEEEVVEMFVAKGDDVPKRYFEFQFSPKGVKFDAKIYNPTGNRQTGQFDVDIPWNAEGLKFRQVVSPDSKEMVFPGKWETIIFLPWSDIEAQPAKTGDKFRLNLFRIDGYPVQNSFQALLPTMKNPADFHVPEKFAHVELA